MCELVWRTFMWWISARDRRTPSVLVATVRVEAPTATIVPLTGGPPSFGHALT